MPIENEILTVKVRYLLDQYLMCLIQEVTKRPSAEILAFFYELASQVADIGAKEKMKKGKGRGIRKNITDYFPGTSVPFNMLVKGSSRKYWDPKTGQYNGEIFDCEAEVSFPEGRTHVKEEELKAISEALMERALLDAPMDGVTIPEFTRPVIRSPRMFKALVDSFAGREPEQRKSRKKKNDGTTASTT